MGTEAPHQPLQLTLCAGAACSPGAVHQSHLGLAGLMWGSRGSAAEPWLSCCAGKFPEEQTSARQHVDSFDRRA